MSIAIVFIISFGIVLLIIRKEIFEGMHRTISRIEEGETMFDNEKCQICEKKTASKECVNCGFKTCESCKCPCQQLKMEMDKKSPKPVEGGLVQKIHKKKKPKRIIVEIEGGLVQKIEVAGINGPIEILVRDFDVEGCEEGETETGSDGREYCETDWSN